MQVSTQDFQKMSQDILQLKNMVAEMHGIITSLLCTSLTPQKDVSTEITLLKGELVHILQNKPVGETENLAKEIVKEILSPTSSPKKLTKVEQFYSDVALKSQHRKLKMIQKASKKLN